MGKFVSSRVSDPDPHLSELLDPDPQPTEKLETDPQKVNEGLQHCYLCYQEPEFIYSVLGTGTTSKTSHLQFYAYHYTMVVAKPTDDYD
jgi:hypothetical protein